jgi:hypothetical protein
MSREGEGEGEGVHAGRADDCSKDCRPRPAGDLLAEFSPMVPSTARLRARQPICRMIIEHHGGPLSASSDGKYGALFQFVLPIDGKSNGPATSCKLRLSVNGPDNFQL